MRLKTQMPVILFDQHVLYVDCLNVVSDTFWILSKNALIAFSVTDTI